MNAVSMGWSPDRAWNPPASDWPQRADLVLGFGSHATLTDNDGPWAALVAHFGSATCVACSTAGEILGGHVSDGGLAALCVQFAGTRVRAATVEVLQADASYAAAAELGRALAAPDLRHVLTFSDGLTVNGTALTAGFRASLPAGINVTGGLAGDGSRFQETLVGLGRAPVPGQVVAIGFYGSRLEVVHGYAGGWEPFGPRRLVTRSVGNVLHTLDDQPALALYKRYLGERASGLPATGLLFPLQLLATRDASGGLVRTILGVDEAAQSLTFAGDIPQGHYVRLMKAGSEALIAGAASAAAALEPRSTGDRFALLVSCVGRRLVLGQRVEEEIEAVLTQLAGSPMASAGFYSYGEISPSSEQGHCDLHNQTMTLTVFSESP